MTFVALLKNWGLNFTDSKSAKYGKKNTLTRLKNENSDSWTKSESNHFMFFFIVWNMEVES